MRILFTIITLLLVVSNIAYSQVTGGQQTFQFLQLPYSAKIASIGGHNISSLDDDVSMVYNNPALLNDSMLKRPVFTFSGYVQGTKINSVDYALHSKKIGLYALGIHYINYGKMKRTDVGGNDLGDFYANEFSLQFSKSHKIDPFTLGGNVKLAVSQLAEYSAYAILLDIGGVYKHPKKDLTAGILIKNAGVTIKSYTGNAETIPFDVQLGLSFKPQHMPLKFNFTAHHLYRYNIAYNNPADINSNIFLLDEDEELDTEFSMREKIARHFTFGGELIFTKNLHGRIGYNYLRRRELVDENSGSGSAGFSWGFMIKIKKIKIDFGQVYYQFAGRPTYLAVSTNLDTIFKKKNREAHAQQ